MPHSVDQGIPKSHLEYKGWANSLSLFMGVAADTVATASRTKWQISTVCKGDQGLMMTLTLDWLSEPYSDHFKLSRKTWNL